MPVQWSTPPHTVGESSLPQGWRGRGGPRGAWGRLRGLQGCQGAKEPEGPGGGRGAPVLGCMLTTGQTDTLQPGQGRGLCSVVAVELENS